MEKKKYVTQKIDESQMVGEPIVKEFDYASITGSCLIKTPSMEPIEENEGIAQIDKSLREIECGKTYSHFQLMDSIWNRIDNYAD